MVNPFFSRSGAQPDKCSPSLGPTWANALALVIWLAAAISAFLPFALNTSPWDAVTLRVPGNQGNWWHALVGAPFFLAFPMVWLRLRLLFFGQAPTSTFRRILWYATTASIGGTILVEVPFLLHLAGTSSWQRFLVLGLGFGIIVSSLTILFLRRPRLSPTQSCMVVLDTAYLANAALCLLVYSDAPGPMVSRVGWYVSIVIFWPILLELVWLFRPTYSEIANV